MGPLRALIWGTLALLLVTRAATAGVQTTLIYQDEDGKVVTIPSPVPSPPTQPPAPPGASVPPQAPTADKAAQPTLPPLTVQGNGHLGSPADRPNLVVDSGKPAAADASKEPKETEEPAKDKKAPAPRTLPQALCAYWKALRSHPCSACQQQADEHKNGQEPNGAADKDEKSPPANGVTNNEKAAKDDSGKDKGEAGADIEARDEKKEEKEAPTETWFSAHVQATMDTQHHALFRSPYVGPLSLHPVTESDTSLTGTLFLDARLWKSGSYTGELVIDPEIAGGSGFSSVTGIAGFTNGDISRVGVVEPTAYFARLFLRQTWGLGGEQEKVEDTANQIAGARDVDRVALTVGKFTFTDVIDDNRYSHDPRTQMQNWSLMYNGAWDYPANVRGYDYGVAIDFNQKYWALRYGIMAEPTVAQGTAIDPRFTDAFGQALEWERRWTVDQHPGKVRLMAYLNRAHMGDYREALTEMPVDPQVTLTRAYRFKYGCGLSAEQELTRDLGLWGRLGWSDGHTESWAFTPIDRTAALGLLLKGRCWARPNDEVGLATVCNGLAKDHRDYLAAGGLDFNIGDGRLNYELEKIVETYYRVAIIKGMYATADFQEIWDPAYNGDRGPVSVVALLVHIEY